MKLLTPGGFWDGAGVDGVLFWELGSTEGGRGSDGEGEDGTHLDG
jgi:hypothetical protein